MEYKLPRLFVGSEVDEKIRENIAFVDKTMLIKNFVDPVD